MLLGRYFVKKVTEKRRASTHHRSWPSFDAAHSSSTIVKKLRYLTLFHLWLLIAAHRCRSATKLVIVSYGRLSLILFIYWRGSLPRCCSWLSIIATNRHSVLIVIHCYTIARRWLSPSIFGTHRHLLSSSVNIHYSLHLFIVSQPWSSWLIAHIEVSYNHSSSPRIDQDRINVSRSLSQLMMVALRRHLLSHGCSSPSMAVHNRSSPLYTVVCNQYTLLFIVTRSLIASFNMINKHSCRLCV